MELAEGEDVAEDGLGGDLGIGLGDGLEGGLEGDLGDDLEGDLEGTLEDNGGKERTVKAGVDVLEIGGRTAEGDVEEGLFEYDYERLVHKDPAWAGMHVVPGEIEILEHRATSQACLHVWVAEHAETAADRTQDSLIFDIQSSDSGSPGP